MKSAEVRQKFLDFFASKQHEIVASAPMVIKNDPTLMLTNAGMNQFKEYFLGHVNPSSKRVADTQKCLRVSGKHNDLEEVGIDTYHHTFFEMLGNWSFGDYFKKEAIHWAWELLTDCYKIAPENLYVTIFEGASDEGLVKDDEAYDLWKEVIPENRILLGNKKDNFWEMGDQGPCGPCSEIHIDLRSQEEKQNVSGATLVNQDHPEVIEVWNLVFISFNRKADGTLEKLPQQHIDTGMGFERLCMVLQNKTATYDTDVFTPLIREIETLTQHQYANNIETNRAIRVIADHIRTVYFAIADGQLPSNTGAGYVIRRILRRAIRYGFTFLNQKKPFIHQLVSTLAQQMGSFFPELVKEQQLAFNVIREEEISFLKTLQQGLLMLDDVLKKHSKQVPGEKAFELYDTYGFPFDLTALIASERGFSVDEKAFKAAMEKQKNRSRAAAGSQTGDWVVLNDKETTRFVGYDSLNEKVQLLRYRQINTTKEGEFFQLVFDHTPFYAEGGGQVGDKGYLEASNGSICYIVDTKKENNLIVHLTKTLPERPEAIFTAVVDEKQRLKTAANHTATHLLHQALRIILGSHVEQKGSMVHSGIFRFDFSHFAKVDEETLSTIEQFVNARIQEQLPLEENRAVPYDEALAQGAMALFGEKYGDHVRTIRFGQSIELCGGTHVSSTADLWHFKIVSETAIAAGIRRIEAITGEAVKHHFEQQSKLLNQVQGVLNHPQDTVKAIQSLNEENAILRKEVAVLSKLKLNSIYNALKENLEKINDIHFIAQKVATDAAGMITLCFDLAKEFDSLVIVLGSESKGKALLNCYISKDLATQKEWNAANIIRSLGKHIQGGGGGQDFFATAGGKNPNGIEKALEEARTILD